jgi:hypothetical protein
MKQNGGCMKLYSAFGLKAIAYELLRATCEMWFGDIIKIPTFGVLFIS